MEVDDAVSSSPVDKGVENGRTPQHSANRVDEALRKIFHGVEEDPPEGQRETPPMFDAHDGLDHMDMENDVKSVLSTPFKLRVSDDEDSQDGVAQSPTYEQQEERDSSRQQKALSAASEDEEVEDHDHVDETDNGNSSLKRKRYEVRRSGSEECLLGFDEQSGEAELVKDDAEMMLKPSAAENVLKAEEKRLEYSVSPPVAKKLKQSSIEKAASKRAATPLASTPSPAPVAEKLRSSLEGELSFEDNKAHVVADIEESTNGTTETANMRAAAAAAAGGSTSKKPMLAQDDFFKKPFEFGWKRELVWRANMETSKDKADVYFITPGGKKLRARSDIAPLLEGDLTIEHFSFAREPLGAGPEFETVRSAKPSSRISITAATLAAAPPPTNMGKRVSKPKGPKGASPPPQGWTPTRALKVNNAALLSTANRHSVSGSVHPSTPPNSRGSSSTGAVSKSSKSAKKPAPQMAAAVAEAHEASRSGSNNTHEPCTIMCARVQGEVPQLQCVKCLCLYHHECVGLNRNNCEYRTLVPGDAVGREYVCEACQPTLVETLPKVPTPAPRSSPSATAARSVRSDNKFPQTIAVVKGKKYVMVAKPRPVPRQQSNAHANDIENDLKQIKESINNIRKPSLSSIEAAFMPHSGAHASGALNTTAVEHSNKLFATNFFANVSFAYDALLCILKYLKIHERPRAASVCKLWHLAAKDTSLWHTVRMKNSKVCNWSGFAAALRRGETKHLDLRKMLLASTRSEEMWQDFSEYIGTVYSLEVIDLCRCSARVVESLFQSNKCLRVLNAIAINDDTIDLNHIGQLHQLEELRLRTCEPGVLADDGLQPLKTLTKLAHLSLTAIRGLGGKSDVHVLAELSGLRSLELGECGDFDETFADVVLPKLSHLQRSRLENGQETGCCTLKILEAVAQLEQLSQLELVNFDIKPGFDEHLQQCTNIRKLLIIPTYISQSATTNHIVLSAVQQVSDTLRVFTWGVTVELLRVTALYVDQCDESTKKQKHHFDECIPVLKPVPGAPSTSDVADGSGTGNDQSGESQKRTDEEVAANEMPQIEILPLDKVECILGENLPHTKYTIVKVPYHATCKQQLVD